MDKCKDKPKHGGCWSYPHCSCFAMTSPKEYYGTTPEGAKECAEDYQRLFDFFSQEHNLILTVSEMDDIIYAVENHNEEMT